jgi:hypothetical protein
VEEGEQGLDNSSHVDLPAPRPAPSATPRALVLGGAVGAAIEAADADDDDGMPELVATPGAAAHVLGPDLLTIMASHGASAVAAAGPVEEPSAGTSTREDASSVVPMQPREPTPFVGEGAADGPAAAVARVSHGARGAVQSSTDTPHIVPSNVQATIPGDGARDGEGDSGGGGGGGGGGDVDGAAVPGESPEEREARAARAAARKAAKKRKEAAKKAEAATAAAAAAAAAEAVVVPAGAAGAGAGAGAGAALDPRVRFQHRATTSLVRHTDTYCFVSS